MQLYAIKFGESFLSSKYVYRDVSSEEEIQISWSFYLAQYDNKTILFDVGFRDQNIAKEWNIALINIDIEMKNLANLSNVDVVFITHGHFDHTDNIDLFENSLIIIYCLR